MVLQGRSGVGKSTLGSEFAYRLKIEDKLFAVRIFDSSKFTFELKLLAKEMNASNLKESLKTYGIKILFVINNVKETDTGCLEYFQSGFDKDKVKVLLTTDSADLSLNKEFSDVLRVKPFDLETSRKFLELRNLTKRLKNSDDCREALKMISLKFTSNIGIRIFN